MTEKINQKTEQSQYKEELRFMIENLEKNIHDAENNLRQSSHHSWIKAFAIKARLISATITLLQNERTLDKSKGEVLNKMVSTLLQGVEGYPLEYDLSFSEKSRLILQLKEIGQEALEASK